MRNDAVIEHVVNTSCTVVASGSEIFRFGISNLLRRELCIATVMEASSWCVAQSYLVHRQTANLIIIHTDVINGQCHTTVRNLRLAYPRLRIVFVGQGQERMKILALISAGAHAYVLESMPMDVIAKAVRMVAAGHVYLPDSVADLAIPEHADDRRTGALTRRQEQVLHLLAEGASNKDIAHRLNLAEGTIKVHLSGLFKALGVHSRAGAVASVHARAY